MTDYFTADLHVGHEAIATLRGYENSAAHDQVVLRNILGVLEKGDRLYVLGDLVSGFDSPAEEMKIVGDFADTLRGAGIQIHIIAGNHDCVHPFQSRSAELLHEYTMAVASVASIGTLKIAGQRAVLSHFPYSGDHSGEDRLVQWRARDLGAPIIHGHTHATEPVSHSVSGSLQVCVSLDAWGMHPVSKDVLSQLIEEHDQA